MAQTARQFFEDARLAAQDAERCRNQLVRLEADAQRVGGSTFEPRVRTSKVPDRMAEKVVTYVQREQSLRRRMERDYAIIDQACVVLYGEGRDGAGGLCAHLSPAHADVVWHRYLGGATWRQTARAVGYAPRPCQYLLGTAFETIDEKGLLPPQTVDKCGQKHAADTRFCAERPAFGSAAEPPTER